jgi:membrane protein DedA with SNARE-associated domain
VEFSGNGLVEFIIANQAWAAPIVALLCFGESLVLIGLFIPATSLMIATGSLLATGRLQEVPIVAGAIIGAALGDWISYLFGRKVGPAAYRHWPLRDHRPTVARARLFFRKQGFIAVFCGRFLGPLRAIVPLVAGVTAMPERKFQMANVTSAILWVPLLFAPGYLSAKHMIENGDMNEGTILYIGFGLGIAMMVGGWALSKLFAAQRRRKRQR